MYYELYIYIYMCVCVRVCGCACAFVCGWIINYINIKAKTKKCEKTNIFLNICHKYCNANVLDTHGK